MRGLLGWVEVNEVLRLFCLLHWKLMSCWAFSRLMLETMYEWETAVV
jgi:hypothetical protein